MGFYLATHRIYVDWNNDGTYTHANSNISTYIDGPGSFQTGRDRTNLVLGRWRSGQWERTFINNTKIFSKNYSSSPIYGLMKKGRRIKETMQIGAGAETTIFAGRLLEVIPIPARHGGERHVRIQAIGIMDWIRRKKNIQIEPQAAIKSGAVASLITDKVGVPSTECDFDDGQTTLVRYLVDGDQNPVEALQDVADNEGGLLGESADGKLTLEDRAHRFAAPHTVSQATYGPAGHPTATVNYSKCVPIGGDEDIFNEVLARVSTYNVTEEKLLWTLVDIFDTKINASDVFSIAAGATKTIKAIPRKESNEVGVYDWTTITIFANTSGDGTGTDLSTSMSVSLDEYENSCILQITNGSASTAWITKLKLYGLMIVKADSVEVSRSDTASIDDIGPSTLNLPAKFLSSIEEAEAFCDYWLAAYKTERTGVVLEIQCNTSAANLEEARVRWISDRITVYDDEGLSADYYVENKRIVFDDQYGVMTMTLRCSPVVGSTWAASAVDYSARSIRLIPSTEVPDQLLWTQAIALEKSIMFYCGAEKWNANIEEAEFRAYRVPEGTNPQSVDLRIVAEGGTFAHNGQDQIIVSDIIADWKGFMYELFYGAYTGLWFWAIRIKNENGWSNWTDGNREPQYVTDNVDTASNAIFDVGPPADFTAKIKAGVQTGTAVIECTRPATNGNRIFSVCFQIRDATAGSWRNLDANAGAAETLYDGSEIDHTFNPLTGELRKDSGTYGDAATEGGLLLIDVRQSSFDHRCCHWIEVSPDQFDGATITGLNSIRTAFDLNANDEYNLLRVKIVRHPKVWNATDPAANDDGFQGPSGYYKRTFLTPQNLGDVESDVFVSPPFVIPTGLAITDLEARIWFENTYSISDDEYSTDVIVESATTTANIPILLHATAHGIAASPPTAGEWAMLRIPAKLYIERVSVLADQAGDCEFDIRVCSLADYPADGGDSIVGATPPALSASASYEDAALSDWTRELNQGDCLVFYLQAGASSINAVSITLHCTDTIQIGAEATPGSDSLPIPWGYWAMDEVSTFVVPNAPSIWTGASGSGEDGKYYWTKQTFQIEGDVESLANGPTYGPIYIPPDKFLTAFWKPGSRSVAGGDWNGGLAGTWEFDIATALANVRFIGAKVYTKNIGGAVGICGYQGKYRDSAGATVYGTLRGTTSGATENEFTLDETEYVTQLQGYYNGSSSFSSKIYQLQFVTNLSSYTYGTASGTSWTINVPADTSTVSNQFCGLFVNYGDGSVRAVGILYYIDSYSEATIPDKAIGWNIYLSEDNVNFYQMNVETGTIDLANTFTFPIPEA